jgi:hypothetical protein
VKDEWWISPVRLSTDDNGKAQFTGFFGDYELIYDRNSKPFSVSHEEAARIQIRL